MATRTIKELVDDLDGTPEGDKPVTTRRFTLDGTQYEIDLHEDNHADLKAAVAKYVKAARVISRPKTGPALRGVAGSKKQQKRIDRAQLDHMRDWLRSQGETVSPFGRIPDRLLERYHAAHPVRVVQQQQPAPVNNQEVTPPVLDDGVPLFTSAS